MADPSGPVFHPEGGVHCKPEALPWAEGAEDGADEAATVDSWPTAIGNEEGEEDTLAVVCEAVGDCAGASSFACSAQAIRNIATKMIIADLQFRISPQLKLIDKLLRNTVFSFQ